MNVVLGLLILCMIPFAMFIITAAVALLVEFTQDANSWWSFPLWMAVGVPLCCLAGLSVGVGIGLALFIMVHP